ncbi:MAG: hypothetical protein RLN88_10605 [Ekhidna sp.]|uniref:hypothetical protein n=1 Tax=Ekhidna sp. TaxID=2608089 RepID=UPI0032EF188E
MRYLSIIMFTAIMVVSCQIEDENAPKPEDAFIKYYGELTSYEANDIEIVYDATGEVPEGLVVFGSVASENGDDDFYVLITDLVGNIVSSNSYELRNDLPDNDEDGNTDFPDIRSNDIAGQIIANPIGGFVFVGTSSFSQDPGISDYQVGRLAFINADLELSYDTFFVVDGDYNLDFALNDITLLQDQSFILGGCRQYNRGGGIIDKDNYFVKYDQNSGIVFEQTQGVAGNNEDDEISRVFEKPNGNLVFVGTSSTPSQRGENGGNNGANVFYLETDPNGTPLNSAAYGFDDGTSNNIVYNELVNNAIYTTSGFSIVGTSSTTTTNQKFAFVMNLSNNGIFLSGNSHDSSAYNTENSVLQTIGEGITQGLDNELVVVGQYPAFSSGGLSRGGEGMFVKFDQGGTPVEGEESSFGLSDGNDNIVDAVTLPDGKIVMVSNVDFGAGVKLISIIKLNPDGSLD